MINLLVQRKWAVKDATIGELFFVTDQGPVFECFTLEDIVRPQGVKIYGETAIPAGTYRIEFMFSQHFQRTLPHLLGVPGFEGILIHPGNSAADTEGCLLVGQIKDLDAGRIGSSKLAFEALYRKLDEEQNIMITIKDV